MMGWQWHQLNHMQAICTSFQKITTPAPYDSDFYGPDALPDTQPTASKHWRLCTVAFYDLVCLVTLLNICVQFVNHWKSRNWTETSYIFNVHWWPKTTDSPESNITYSIQHSAMQISRNQFTLVNWFELIFPKTTRWDQVHLGCSARCTVFTGSASNSSLCYLTNCTAYLQKQHRSS